MESPRAEGPDVNHGTNVFIACWTLTALVACVLLFRGAVKAHIYFISSTVPKPQRVWDWDDLFFFLGYAFDIASMSMIWESSKWGLGHYSAYLSTEAEGQALRWMYTSEPVSIAASICSRTGAIAFLYRRFTAGPLTLRLAVLACLVIQVVANLAAMSETILQCGPRSSGSTNRAAYFHYLWEPLPNDGSVVCASLDVKALIGYIQGAFDAAVDWTTAALSAYELWGATARPSNCSSEEGSGQRSQVEKVRIPRLWMTVVQGGPLLLAGTASIMKSIRLSKIESQFDFTSCLIPFIFWTKFENSCLSLAACAPAMRLFVGSLGNRSSEEMDDPFANRNTAVTVITANDGQDMSKRPRLHSMRDSVTSFGNTRHSLVRSSLKCSEKSKQGFRQFGSTTEDNISSASTRLGSEDVTAHPYEAQAGGPLPEMGIMVKREYEVRVEGRRSYPGSKS